IRLTDWSGASSTMVPRTMPPFFNKTTSGNVLGTAVSARAGDVQAGDEPRAPRRATSVTIARGAMGRDQRDALFLVSSPREADRGTRIAVAPTPMSISDSPARCASRSGLDGARVSAWAGDAKV